MNERKLEWYLFPLICSETVQRKEISALRRVGFEDTSRR